MDEQFEQWKKNKIAELKSDKKYYEGKLEKITIELSVYEV